jgi:hypothetical protein
MKIFRIGSSTVIPKCHFFLKFLAITCQNDLRTAEYLQLFAASENFICQSFLSTVIKRLIDIYLEYGNSVISVSDLCRAIENMFFK